MNEQTTNQGGQKVKTKKDIYLNLKIARANYRSSLLNLELLSKEGVDKVIFGTIKSNTEYRYKLFCKALDTLRKHQEKHGYNA
jgi:hypothetical protein